MPEVHLLSNGAYHVMVTPAGGGYSRCKGLAVTRWREDATLDNWGTFCYLRDCAGGAAGGAVRSTPVPPTLQRPDRCETNFSPGVATFSRCDQEIETRTEIAVSLDDDVELRRVRITNLSGRCRTLDATSYAEIVLAAPGSDSPHPAFSKLSVETEIDPVLHAIFATRRPGAPDDPTPWLFHPALAADASAGEISYETDRMRFVGRGRSAADFEALRRGAALAGSAGPVLDAALARDRRRALCPRRGATVLAARARRSPRANPRRGIERAGQRLVDLSGDLEATGDTRVLDESCHFLESRPLKDGEQSNYELPQVSNETGNLYEHCVRSIRRGMRYGEHGLPLMGSGDWNDGMNLVGAGGKGESVWLAFFLFAVLTRFGPLARNHSDVAFADLCQSEGARLRPRIDASSWDGAWYRRACFDDVSPLGSANNIECQIDSIAQSWSVLSGAADAERARSAMEAVDHRLGHRDTRLVQLLDPPFETSMPTPGSIQGHVPASARTEVNTPMLPFGSRWHSRRWATPSARGNCSRCSTRYATPAAPATSPPTKSSPMPSPATSVRSRRTPDAAAGPGTPGPPAGCIA